MKLSQRRKTALALAVAATILGGSNAYAAVEHDKAISESNQYGDSMRTYWQTQGIYDATKHSYTFSDDVTLKPKASEQDLNYWTPMFGGIYIAGDNSATIDMQGHRLDVAMNVDQVKVGSVNNINAINANGIHVTSSGLTINNLKGMDISVSGAFLSTGMVRGIYVSGTNQEGAYNDGEGRASLTINNADGWDNAVKFHSSQSQVENAIEVKKNTGSADLSISGMVDLYVGNDSDVIYVSGGNSYYGIEATPTAYIGGGAIKASMGRAANISGGSLFINSTLDNGKIAATDGDRDVQVEGNILVKDLQSDQGTLTLAMNTAKSYFNGVINSQNGMSDAGDAYMLLQNGAQWTNASKGDYSYSGSALKQFAGGSSAAGTGYIFQNDSSALNLGDYSGYTTIFYSHSDDGTQTSQYSGGNTIVNTAKAGSNITLVTDNVDSDNDTTVAAALNALAGKLYYNDIKNGENALDGTAVIADGLTASSKSLKTAAIYFNEDSGQGTTTSTSKQGKTDFTTMLTGVTADDSEYAEANIIADDGSYKFDKATTIAVKGNTINAKGDITIKADKTLTLNVKDVTKNSGHGINMDTANTVAIKTGLLKMDLTGTDITSDGLQGVRITNGDAKLTLDGDLDITVNGDNNTIGIYNRGNVVVNGDVKLDVDGNNGGFQYYGATGIYATSSMGSTKGGNVTVNGNVDFQGNANGLWSNAGGGVVTVKGGSIVVKEGQTMGYAAIKAENGVVNMNVVRDADGNVTGADSNDVTIKGNLSLDTGAVNANDINGTKSEINLGLTTQKSSLTGVVQNSFGDSGKTAGGLTFTGAANLWLQNGATWNNEVVDKIITAPLGGEKWTGSHVAKLVGSTSEAAAGNIFQNDTNRLIIDSYSGNTNIYYAHEGNGEAAENYTAGDTIIKSAAADSVVSMITDNTNVATDNNDSVANVLNALAGKLTYSNFASGEANLTGYVKIADGLTASSKAMKTGDITFNDEGKGTYVKKEVVEKSAFTTALTGNKTKDTEYEGNINSDGSYFFTKDSTITLAGIAENGGAINAEADLTVKADAALDLKVNGSNQTSYGLTQTNGKQVVINAQNLNIDVTNSYGRADAIHVNGSASGARGSLTVNGDVSMKSTHDASGGYAGDYTLGAYAMQSDITINGNVTSVIDAGSGANAYYGATHLYATGATGSQTDGYKAATITVNGDVDLSGTAQGIFANIGGAVVTVNGGGKITLDQKAAKSNGYAAIRAEDSFVNMNVKLDETGKKATAGLGNDVVIKGNVTTSVGAVNSIDTNGTMTRINLALDTAKSSLDGALVNGFDRTDGTTGIDTEADEGGTVSKHFDGEINLWLQNGAQWNNKLYGSLKFFSDDKYKTKFQGSHVTDFVGGSDAAHTGYIAQNTSEKLTIDNYSGYATLFYSHTANTDLEDLDEDDEQYTEDASTLDGSQTWHYLGDTIIKKAAADSHIALVTDNANINTADSEQVNKVLNALAGKLYYNAYVNNERNLAGTVSIADGLTASSFSKTYQSGDITFSETTGQGSYSVEKPAKTEFTTTLTGVKSTDKEYYNGGVIVAEGNYKFTENSSITTIDAHGADMNQATTVNAAGKTLTFNTNVTGKSTIHAIGANTTEGVTITADKLVINANSTNGRVEGINVGGQGAQNKDNPMKLTINGDTEMNVNGVGYTLGLYAAGNSEVTFNGNITAIGNEESQWGLASKNGAWGYYGCSLVYSGNNYSLQMGPKVTVNGDVNAKIDGNGLFANGGHAKLTINGGGNIEINKDNTHNYYAMIAESATTSINVNLDKDYNAVSARDNKLVLKGNVGVSTGAVNANEPELYTYANIGLATADSEWTGVAHNAFKEEGVTSGSKTFYGAINVFLQNGATWNNEKWGKTASPYGGLAFTGSRVAKFVGGESAAKAGNIFQNDSNSLTIDSYSGNTNIYYAHTGNGEAGTDYAAGDTIIKSAAADSVVSMITDNSGVAMDNEDSVANVLNALAGKLTYSNFVSGENNLTGYVKIADGLTASSKALQTGDITFSETTGQGSYSAPVGPEPKTEFTTPITGDTAADTEYAGNIQDGKYVFAADTTVKVAGASVVDVKTPFTAEAGSNKLSLVATKGDWSGVSTAFSQNVAGTTKITAGELVIGASSDTDLYDRSAMVVQNGAGVDITAANTTIYAHNDLGSVAYGIYAKDNKSRVDIHGDLKLEVEGMGLAHGLLAEDTSYMGGNASIINVDGKADISVKKGNAVAVIRSGSTINLGGGTVQIDKDSSSEHYALKADGGSINVNMNADKTAAGSTKTVIKGNLSAYGAKTYAMFDMDDTDSTINLGLSGSESSLTGAAFCMDTGSSSWPFKGFINMYLDNGATWNNEQWGKINSSFTGSHVTKLVGGTSEAAAGNIFQNDSKNLTIDSYSGNTNIYYAHTGSGEAAGNYAAGDTIIKSAAAGSVVSLITDNTNVAIDNESSVANVLNSLAGKLTYSNYVSGENNLTGYVKIADGLTASSNTLKVDNIKYNATTGQGYTKTDVIIPDEQTDDSFTEVITGEQQETYVNSGVQKEDKSYVFTKDTTVSINQMTKKEADPDWEGSYLVSGAAVQNSTNVKEVVINAADKTLKLDVALDDNTVPPTANAGILNNRIPLRGVDNSVAGSTTSITAGTLDINVDNTYSRKTSSGNPLIGAGSAAGIYANSTGDKAVVDVTGNTAIKAHGYNNVYGITASGNSEVKLHGDLTMAKAGDVWAIDNVINGSNTTTLGEASWRNIAGISASGAGANVTVDGKTTVAAHGSGVVALDGATVNLGDADIELKNNADEQGYAFHAIGAALGTVNVGGEGKTVSVKGNVGLFGKQGQQFSSDSKTSVVNLQLTNDASTWTGVAYKYFTDDEKTAGYDGSLNLTLANGATWNNEKYGHTYGDADWEKYKFTGSRVAKFVGGESAAKAGNIFQNDSNSLTIDSYSGNTNIYYVHTGNGEEAADYAAGNTIIKSAAAGSGVSMITDNSGVDMDNEASVKNVLNSLAGKLIYSNYTVGERNLAGYVKIADGLTASSKALQAGDISFNETTGQGSYKTGSLTPGYTYPDSQQTDKFTQPITGDEKQDNVYKQQGVLKDDGEYVFTQNPTEITVDSGAAVDASEHNVNIDTSKAKLELNGKDQGILADGHDVDVKGSTEISGTTGIEATNGGNVTLEGLTNITGTDSAITAGSDSSVNISGGAATIKGGLNADGGNITIDGGKTTTEIEGNVNANNGGSIELTLNEKSSTLTGGYSAGENSSIVLNLQSGATWNLQDGPAAASDTGSLTVNGGAAQGDGGYIIMNRTKDLNIDNYSGWETVIYSHENAGSDATDYKAGDTVIAQAAAGSGVVLSTDNSGITMTDKSAVENTLKALARKVVYSDHEANGSNLTGKVQIADGLTAASVSKYLGSVSWDADGRGQYNLDSIDWKEIVEGDYETLVMKGVRSAATTSLHSWRDNMQDTYTGADLADEDGIFVKALGGKTSSEVKGVKDSNTYYGVQVGYDKALGNGWHTGVAFDYRDGDSDYLLGGKGDNQLYSLGVYGVKSFADQSYLRVAAKAGRVENEYDVYNEIRSLKLHGDYKANAYGLTMEYGKTFGQEDTYITPKVQLTWSQVGSKDYSAHTANDSMRIAQDSYSSFVGRLGFEAGVKSAKGRLYAGLYAAHEFNGEITASYYAKDGGMKHTSFDGEDTWMEMSIGGAYALSNNCHFYADFVKDFGGDFQRKWKANAGLRFEF